MVLDNPRYELFAEELAKGVMPEESYRLAGFKPHRQNAHRLMSSPVIKGRVRELQAEAASSAKITIESLTADLLRIGNIAEGLGDASGLAVARASRMDIAKLNGLIVEKLETKSTVQRISAEPLSEDEWVT